MRIDLNCDLGEGCPHDAELMPLITSANVACGAHAGDAHTMAATLALARRFGVQVGAHPGFPDREHFGRRELSLSDDQVFQDCIYQIGALWGLAQAAGVAVRYVKPHGALYNQACRGEQMAGPVVAAAHQFGLPVMGLPASVLAEVCERKGVRFIAEGFADRRYRADGSLAPRSEPDAFVTDPREAAEQAEGLIRQRGVHTICVHGDNPEAVEFLRHLRQHLTQRGFDIRAF